MQIIPTILAKNKFEFKNKIQEIKNFGFKITQIDICDSYFVKNKTYYNLSANLNFELHLMVANPEKYIKANNKIKRIIFHLEAVENPEKIIAQIKQNNFQVGIAINPETEIIKIKKYLNKIDLVLLMSVHPGFSGQKFLTSTINKIKKLRQLDKKIKLEIDGGINYKIAKKLSKLPVDILAIGSNLRDFI